MWILIFWLSSPFNVSSGDARQPTLAVHSQAFHTERACRDALRAIKKENVGEFSLRAFVFLTENRRRQRAHDEYYRQTYTSPYVLVGTHHGSTGRRIKA